MLRFTTIALILAAAAPAQADDASSYARQFAVYQNMTAEMLRDPRSTYAHSGNPDDCYEMVLQAKASGIAADTVIFKDNGKDITLSAMGDHICRPHQRAHHLVDVMQGIKKGHDANVWLKQIEMSANHPENQAMLEKSAKECTDAAARGVQLGFGDVEFDTGIFVDQAKQKICDPLAKSASTFAAEVQKAAQAAEEEAKAPFKAAGIKGDKLHICGSYADRTFRGKGGVELSPAQVKKSNLLFFWSGPDSSSGLYYLQRYAFKGDKLVGQSEVKLIRPPVAKDFR